MKTAELATYKADQKNQLVYGSTDMTGREKLLYYLAVVNLTKYSENFPCLRVSAKDLAEFLGLETGGNYYRQITTVCRKLLSRVVEIEDDAKWRGFQYVSRCTYERAEGIVEIQLHDDLKPYLLSLDSNFASIPFTEISQLRNQHAIALYEFLYHARRENGTLRYKMIIDLDRIMRKLGIHKKKTYQKDSNAVTRLIKRSLKEINDKAPIKIDMEVLRARRKGSPVEGYMFTFETNENWTGERKLPVATEQMMLSLLETNNPNAAKKIVRDTINQTIDKQLIGPKYDTWIAQGLTPNKIDKCFKWANAEIRRRSDTDNPVKDPAAFAIWAVDNKKGL